MVLYLNKFKSPSSKDALCQIWLKFCFYDYLPLKRDWALRLNKLESLLAKEALCQVWLNLAQWFWRGRFLNLVNVFWLSPLG